MPSAQLKSNKKSKNYNNNIEQALNSTEVLNNCEPKERNQISSGNEKKLLTKRLSRYNKVSSSDNPIEVEEMQNDVSEKSVPLSEQDHTSYILDNRFGKVDDLEDLSSNGGDTSGLRINSLKKKSRRKDHAKEYGTTKRNNKNNKDNSNNNSNNNNNNIDNSFVLSTSENWNNLNIHSNVVPLQNTALNVMPKQTAKLNPLPIKPLEVDDLRCYPRHPASKDIAKLKTTNNERNLLTEEISRIKSSTGASLMLQDLTDSGLDCWMSNLPSGKRNLPIHRLLIPGSHDSFSYSLKWGEISPDSPTVVPYLAACFPCIAWPALLRWSVTQRATVYEQLTHGIRYFDIRVAVRNNRFYFVHGLYGEDLEDLLGEMRNFLDRRSGEVVLLDFQHLHGLSKEDHLFLGDLLKNVFDGIICPPYESLAHLSLSYLAKQKYQNASISSFCSVKANPTWLPTFYFGDPWLMVLIFYRHSENQKEFGFWSDALLPNPWPHTTKISTMMSFVKEELEKKSHKKFFVTQCVLTPTGSYLSRNLRGSLKRKMADPCNREVLQWILSLSTKNKLPNVIMTDFVDNDNWAIPKAIVRHNMKSST